MVTRQPSESRGPLTVGAARALGVLLVAALVGHAVTKRPDRFGEMLWVCHVATAVLALGLFSGRQPFVAAGFLMHLSWGAPAYLLDVAVTRSTTISSALVHALPLLAGARAVAARGWPPGVVLPAWIFYLLWVPISYAATNPALNVNLAHAPWPPLASVLPTRSASWAFNAGASLLSFFVVDRLLRAWQGRRDARARAARASLSAAPAAAGAPSGATPAARRSDDPMPPPLPLLGALAFLCLALHGAEHVRRGELDQLLWLSNVATLILAAGCAGRRPLAVALAALWLSLSALLWLADVVVARNPVDSAVLTHLGSFAIAMVAARGLRMPAHSWRWATGALALLVGLCRLVTARAHNVNLAFAVAPGWEGRFDSHGLYLGSLLLLAAALFFAVERTALRGARTAEAARP